MAENKKLCAYVSSNEIQQPKKYKIDMIEKKYAVHGGYNLDLWWKTKFKL